MTIDSLKIETPLPPLDLRSRFRLSFQIHNTRTGVSGCLGTQEGRYRYHDGEEKKGSSLFCVGKELFRQIQNSSGALQAFTGGTRAVT